MPEEIKPELESTDSKIIKDIYIDSKGVDNFWVNDSNINVGKPVKGSLENLILTDCDERVLLLMESDCSTEDLMMEDEILSDWSNEISFEGENVVKSMILEDESNVDVSVSEVSVAQDHGGEQILHQDASEEADVINPMPSSVITDRNSAEHSSTGFSQYTDFYDHERDNMISYRRELDDENSIMMQQYSGTLPYSGSISLRSTSSTASTQSFAFPVLAQEWSNSPVRMPKADKRQLQQTKHWKKKMCWVCCKF